MVGGLFAFGALLLAGAPPFTAFAGKSLLEAAASVRGYGWLIALFVLISPLTGGAVLRITGRIFLGGARPPGPTPSRRGGPRSGLTRPAGSGITRRR